MSVLFSKLLDIIFAFDKRNTFILFNSVNLLPQSLEVGGVSLKKFLFIWYFTNLIVPLTWRSKVLRLDNTAK